MLGINCIKLIFGYMYFSPNTFPKIYQKLGGQLELLFVDICDHCMFYIFNVFNHV